MRRQIFLASIGAIALAGSAFAAEPIPVPPPVPAFTWTGVYAGGQIGYAWDTASSTNVSGFIPPRFPAAASIGGNPSGAIGGANVGYNYQIGQWVLGLEGTVDGTGISNSGVAFFPGILGNSTATATTTATVEGSIRGRAGFAWDRLLIYGTGGVVFGGFNTNIAFSSAASFLGSSSVSATRAGWTAGGGLQYAITNNWSVRAEYRYSDFGSITGGVAGLRGAFLNGTRQINQNQVQVGFDYRFDWGVPPAPVAAKY